MTTAALARETTAVTLPIGGMSCAACVGRVEEVLSGVDGVAAAAVNLAAESATAEFDPARTDAAALAAAVDAAGYAVPTGTTRLRIAGMDCASCVPGVERALRAVPGVLEATINFASGRAQVSVIRGLAPRAELGAAIEAAGFRVVEPEAASTAEQG